MPRHEQLHSLSTEFVGAEFQGIGEMSSLELVSLINREDAGVAHAVSAALPAIAAAIDACVASLERGGRIVYMGAGTSGRLGVLDAAECGPTFNAAEAVIAVIAGGPAAVTQAAEGAEDDTVAAKADLVGVGLGPEDILVGISASGRTPYVCAGIEFARELGATTVGISCNTGALLSTLADFAVEVDTGAEVIAGSTRMKAATAQKMILNMISTASMVRIGKTFGNMMADLRISNEKLMRRGVRIVAQVSNVSEEVAESVLKDHDFNVREAVESLRRSATSHG